MASRSVPYAELLEQAKQSGRLPEEHLRAILPDVFLAAYLDMTPRQTNVIVMTSGTFDYVYDNYAELVSTGVVEPDDITESRLVCAVGISRRNTARRDDGRLRGWVGPTGATFGTGWDKGHFIAHTIGGAVDGLEMNVFLQRRSVNRGGYRRLERYCAANPGVLCFSRPIYSDRSAVPSEVEFGVLRPDGMFDLEIFANR